MKKEILPIDLPTLCAVVVALFSFVASSAAYAAVENVPPPRTVLPDEATATSSFVSPMMSSIPELKDVALNFDAKKGAVMVTANVVNNHDEPARYQGALRFGTIAEKEGVPSKETYTALVGDPIEISPHANASLVATVPVPPFLKGPHEVVFLGGRLPRAEIENIQHAATFEFPGGAAASLSSCMVSGKKLEAVHTLTSGLAKISCVAKYLDKGTRTLALAVALRKSPLQPATLTGERYVTVSEKEVPVEMVMTVPDAAGIYLAEIVLFDERGIQVAPSERFRVNVVGRETRILSVTNSKTSYAAGETARLTIEAVVRGVVEPSISVELFSKTKSCTEKITLPYRRLVEFALPVVVDCPAPATLIKVLDGSGNVVYEERIVANEMSELNAAERSRRTSILLVSILIILAIALYIALTRMKRKRITFNGTLTALFVVIFLGITAPVAHAGTVTGRDLVSDICYFDNAMGVAMCGYGQPYDFTLSIWTNKNTYSPGEAVTVYAQFTGFAFGDKGPMGRIDGATMSFSIPSLGLNISGIPLNGGIYTYNVVAPSVAGRYPAMLGISYVNMMLPPGPPPFDYYYWTSADRSTSYTLAPGGVVSNFDWVPLYEVIGYGASGSISATNNPCSIASGANSCSPAPSISWSTSGATNPVVEVVGSISGSALFGSGASSPGQSASWITDYETFTFNLRNNGLSGPILASVIVDGRCTAGTTWMGGTTGSCQPPQCSDGVDNADPEDTLVDLADPGCTDASDNDETDPSCSWVGDIAEVGPPGKCVGGVDPSPFPVCDASRNGNIILGACIGVYSLRYYQCECGGSPQTAPTLIQFDGEVNPIQGTNYVYSLNASDPNSGDSVRYEIDWYGDGMDAGDTYYPGSSSYVPPATLQSVNRIWPTPGTYTARARVCDQGGLCSAWTTLSPITVSAQPAPIVTLYPGIAKGPDTLMKRFAFWLTRMKEVRAAGSQTVVYGVDTATLTWSTANNPTFCEITSSWAGYPNPHLVNPTGGTETVPGLPVGTWDFTITCTNAGGSDTDTATMIVRLPQCSNGLDDDGDGPSDAADASCHMDGNPGNPASYNANDDDEAGPAQCSDTFDNDSSGAVDMSDPSCSAPSDNDETNPIVPIPTTVPPGPPPVTPRADPSMYSCGSANVNINPYKSCAAGPVLHNVGEPGSAYTVTSVVSSNSSEFWCTNCAGIPPVTPGNPFTLTLAFRPSAEGVRSSTITITLSTGDVFNIVVTGDGVMPFAPATVDFGRIIAGIQPNGSTTEKTPPVLRMRNNGVDPIPAGTFDLPTDATNPVNNTTRVFTCWNGMTWATSCPYPQIDAGQYLEMRVRFAPVRPERFTTRPSLSSYDGEDITLDGWGATGRIRFEER